MSALAIVLVAIHFALPPNREGIRFVRGRIALFPSEWRAFRAEQDPEQRLRASYGMNYDAPVFIRDHLGPGERLQLPPRAYVSTYCPPGEDGWTDPRFITYVAGSVRSFAWLGQVRPEATHALVVDTLNAVPGLRIIGLDSPEQRDRVTGIYRRAERRGR